MHTQQKKHIREDCIHYYVHSVRWLKKIQQTLCESEVAFVCERSVHQLGCIALVLVGVGKLGVVHSGMHKYISAT